MSEINPLSNDQIFLKKIAENTGSDYNTGDVSEINPLTIDQILLKEIAANTAGQSGDMTELEEKVTANAEAIEATQDMISDAYDPTATYAVGEYCIYNDTLYKCNTAIATGEAFTPAKWTATNTGDELKRKQAKIYAKHVEYAMTILGGDDQTFSDVEIMAQGNISAFSPVLIVWDGVRPVSSWQEVNCACYYNAITNRFGAHNYGTGGNALISFTVLYK